jgi:hypothetical protein
MKVVLFWNENHVKHGDYMEMQSKNKISKIQYRALIYFLLKSDIEKNFNQKYRYMNAKYLILPFFLSSLSIAQETNPSANKSGSSFR